MVDVFTGKRRTSMQNRSPVGAARLFGLRTSAFRHVRKALFGFSLLAMMGSGCPSQSSLAPSAPTPTPTATPSPTTATAAVIRGTVTIDGLGAAGLTVSLSAGPSGGTATTDASGNYEFDFGMPDGAYLVTLRDPPSDVEFPATTQAATITPTERRQVVDFAGLRSGVTSVDVTHGGVLRVNAALGGNLLHDEFVFNAGDGTGAQLRVSIVGSSITITPVSGFGPSSLPVLTGTITAGGSFTVSGSGLIAGVDGVSVTATGETGLSETSGLGLTITVGEDGTLPGGQPIFYGFSSGSINP
jgi:hypothetical protein